MANFITTSGITDPSILQPFTGPSLNFLQQSTSQQIAGAVAPLIYDQTAVTILEGCTFTTGQTGSIVTYTIASGYCWAANTIYYLEPAIVNVTITGATSGYTVCGTLFTSDPLGPVTFSDGIQRTIFQVQTIACNAQPSGTGFLGNSKSDFLNFQSNSGNWQTYTFPNSTFSIDGGGTTSAATGIWTYKTIGNTMFFNAKFNFSIGSVDSPPIFVLMNYSSLFSTNNITAFQPEFVGQDSFGGVAWGIQFSDNFTGGHQMLLTPLGGYPSAGVYSIFFGGSIQID